MRTSSILLTVKKCPYRREMFNVRFVLISVIEMEIIGSCIKTEEEKA